MKKSQLLYSRGYSPTPYPTRDWDKTNHFRKKIIVSLWILFGFLVVFYVLCLSPFFGIKDIKIAGNRAIDTQEIQDSLNNFLFKKFLVFFNQNNIFLARDNQLKSVLLADFSRILSVDIHKNILQKTINVEIVERKEVGIFCSKACYYIDKDGVIFEDAPQTSGTLILVIKDNSEREVEMGKNVVDGEFMAELINLKNDLLNQLGLKVLDFAIESEAVKDVRANTNEGWYILFDGSQDFENQLQTLKLVLEEKIKENRKNLEYIDLRIENRVYYK